MRSEDEFKTFYQDNLEAKLIQVDTIRKDKLKRAFWTFIYILGLILFVVVGLSQSWLTQVFRWIWIISSMGIFFYLMYRLHSGKNKLNFKSAFKQKAILPIVKFISHNLQYFPEKHIPRRLYDESRLFLKGLDSYKGDDLIQGKIDKTFLQFSELHTRYKSTDSKGRTHWHDVFKGLFFVADFNKNFDGSTVLLPNHLGGGFSFFKKIFGLNRKEKLVELADPQFTDNFTCYSTDDIKARYILTPSLMERLNDFHKKYPKNRVSLSFVDGQVFVAIAYSKDLFEPSLFRSVVNYDRVKSYFDDIRLVVEIVEDLNLNNRIWTKE